MAASPRGGCGSGARRGAVRLPPRLQSQRHRLSAGTIQAVSHSFGDEDRAREAPLAGDEDNSGLRFRRRRIFSPFQGAGRVERARAGAAARIFCCRDGGRCARRGVPLPTHCHVGKLSGNKMHLGFMCFTHRTLQPAPAPSLRPLPGRGVGPSRRGRRGAQGRAGSAAGAPVVPPRSHKSPGRRGREEGRERARARRVPRATAGTIPHIFVQTFTCQPSLQHFFPLLILLRVISVRLFVWFCFVFPVV